MDNGLVLHATMQVSMFILAVLILIVVDNGLVPAMTDYVKQHQGVLILIVVDNGLVHYTRGMVSNVRFSLNPYCSGQWSRTQSSAVYKLAILKGLNPYCSGQWSRTVLIV